MIRYIMHEGYIMAIERTVSIIKPDAVAKNIIGQIYTRFEDANLKIIAAKMIQLNEKSASEFYSIHKDRPFFAELITFMTSGPIIVQLLEGESAITKNRELMGATNPAERKKGTIRGDFSESYNENAVHGSDSVENAKIEAGFFFTDDEICLRT